jgi:hypothetical protein
MQPSGSSTRVTRSVPHLRLEALVPRTRASDLEKGRVVLSPD